MWGAACTGFVYAVKSRAAGMSWLPQLIQSSIVGHSLLVQNHCQLINAMFSFFFSFFFLSNPLPHFLSLFHSSSFPRGNQCFICCQIPRSFREIYFCNEKQNKKFLLARSYNSFKTHPYLHCIHIIRAMCGLYDGGRLSLSTVCTVIYHHMAHISVRRLSAFVVKI